ncbi:glycerophosphodiester phosphodiesterase [Candidatus Bipolaricaulota sp. J31]
MEIITHRGASWYVQENSREAIALARRLGADRIELDVRATADGILLVLHDETLERTTTGEGPLRAYKFRELHDVRLKNGEPLLTLEEAMDCSAGIPLYLDIKDEESLEPLVWTLQRTNREVVVSSKDMEFLKNFRRKEPRHPISLQLREPVPEATDLALEVEVTFVHPCWEKLEDPLGTLLKGHLHSFRTSGLQVILWHEEDPEMLKKVRSLGDSIYGITTARPDLARRVLK